MCSKMIDVEIDGGTHNLDYVKAIDKKRDRFSKKNGWKVIRFTAKEVLNDLDGCIEKTFLTIKKISNNGELNCTTVSLL